MSHQVTVMISQEQIATKVAQLGLAIDEYYQNNAQELVLVGLLRGSFVFMADLCRAITRPHELDFMTVSSYNKQLVSSGEVKIVKDLDGDISGKNVVIVEDIIDSGHTLAKVVQLLKTHNPHSVEVCTLISKPSRRVVDIEVKFLGFEMPNKFIVGYGLDYDQHYRHLPYIGEIGL